MITINGNNKSPADYALAAIMAAEGIDPATRGIAVALNDTVVPRGRWGQTVLAPGDRLEIVKVLQGG